jgi:hypothetical protein
MFIAIIIDDTPEFVIFGELERNKLFKLYKKREHDVMHHKLDMETAIDGVDKDKARKNLDDILSGRFKETKQHSEVESNAPFEDPIPEMPEI